MKEVTSVAQQAPNHQGTSAQSFVEQGGKERRNLLQQRLYDSLQHAQREGARSLSRRELRDHHFSRTGEFLELSSVASSVNALLASNRLTKSVERQCTQPPHRLVGTVRCTPVQLDIKL